MIAAALLRTRIMKRELESSICGHQNETFSLPKKEQGNTWRTGENEILTAEPQRSSLPNPSFQDIAAVANRSLLEKIGKKGRKEADPQPCCVDG